MDADELVELRARRKMTRKALAAFLEISQTTLLAYERAERPIPKLVAYACTCLVLDLPAYGERWMKERLDGRDS